MIKKGIFARFFFFGLFPSSLANLMSPLERNFLMKGLSLKFSIRKLLE